MKKVAVALGMLGPDSGSFFARAQRRATPKYAKQCATGQEIIKTLIEFSNDKDIIIGRVDIFGHGYDCGVIGMASNWEGLFSSSSTPVDSSVKPAGNACSVKTGMGGATVNTLAEAIIKNKIRIDIGGEVGFWSCNSYALANNLQDELRSTFIHVTGGAKTGPTKEYWPNRSDIVVVGSKGACMPYPGGKMPELGIMVKDDGDYSKNGAFYFLQCRKTLKQEWKRLFIEPMKPYPVPQHYKEDRV